MQKLIRELRRREVFRTTGLYVGIAWITIEGASVLLPAFDAPEWVLRALIITAIIGLPVAVVLAWVFDISDRGIEVQADPTDTVIVPFGGRRTDFLVIGVLSIALIFSVYVNITSGPGEIVKLDPVSVLIADFDNQTGDELFDGTLEQALQIGIESASFITGYRRDTALRLAASLQPTDRLDLAAATLVSLREGIKLVMAGSIAEDDGEYLLYVRAIDPKLGEVLAESRVDAKTKLDVLTAIGTLAGDLREALGDKSLDRDRLVTSETFTAKSLEAAKAYAQAQSLQYAGKYEESMDYYRQALEHDADFGRAYSGLALSASSLGKTDEEPELWKKALANMGSMTERERLRTLGLYYSRVTRNRQKAIENYRLLIDKYPADDAAHNGLAIQYFYTLDFDSALKEGRALLDIYPSSIMGRSNYALYAMYAGDFDTAITEARNVQDQDPGYFKAWLPIAMQALAMDDTPTAIAAYEAMAKSSARGGSTANLGLADVAIYGGKFADARSLLAKGIQSDEAAGNRYVASTKQLALAGVLLAEGNTEAALQAIDRGLALSSGESRLVPAALIYVRTGETARALEIAATLGENLQPKSRAYGKLIEAQIQLDSGSRIEAIDTLSAAVELADLWLIRFYRGKAYLDAGYFAEALDEFMACEERRGEATAIFLDDLPTWRYTSTLPHWLGRAREELGISSSAP